MVKSHARNETGSVLIAVVFVVIALAGLVLSMMSQSEATKREYDSRLFHVEQFYIADAGIAHALTDLRGGGTGNLGTTGSPVSFGPGGYVVTVVDNGDHSYTITSTGTVAGGSRKLQALAREAQGVFHHAMFAGNSSGDPTYSLDLAGGNPDADLIDGDIFCAQDISITEDAVVTGELRAGGTISGASGETGVTQPLPSIAEMGYETNHDVNVAAEFAANEAYAANALGGSAWEVPDTLRSHIFRRNPSDRETECLATTKNDYFLEDPYENVSSASSLEPTAVTQVSLGDSGGTPLRLVYYVDGNLWLHNKNSFSFALVSDQPVQVTFVVKGNIYFADNVLLHDGTNDGLAFIAIKDEAVPDSGNVYFGDPVYGTLRQMDAYMFAENDFVDQNLPATGSQVVTVNGIMSAGNQIAIDRDDGTRRSQLLLNFDDRVKKGLIDLPGLPTPKTSVLRFPISLVALREVANDP